MAKDPSISFLRECFFYNAETGIITWQSRPEIHFTTARAFKTWHTRFCGKDAGGLSSTGYIDIGMQSRLMKAHRIAWALSYGEYPKGDIDHINGVRHDNRLCNLRDVGRKDNSRNSAKHKNNQSGISGVRWRQRDNRWVAEINHEGKQRHLGYFTTLIDASCARKSAENRYKYHPNHGKR